MFLTCVCFFVCLSDYLSTRLLKKLCTDFGESFRGVRLGPKTKLFTMRCTYRQCKERYCHHVLSIHPSICLSVTMMSDLWSYTSRYFESNYMDNQLRSLPFRAPTWQSSPREATPKFGWNSGGVAIYSRKPAVSLKRGKLGPRLLLMTNMKWHGSTRFRLVLKSMTLDDLELPLPTILYVEVFLGAHHENLNEERPWILSTAKMQPSKSSFWQYKVHADIGKGSLERGVKRQCYSFRTLGNKVNVIMQSLVAFFTDPKIHDLE